MDCEELSDLEEGEILEYDSDTLSTLSESWSEEFGNLKNHCNLVVHCRNKGIRNKENKAKVLHSSENNGYKKPSIKNQLSDKSENRSNLNIMDLGLEEVSSDGDCLSDEDCKHSYDGLDYRIQKKKRSQFCGTADDIMSEIGETISRKKSHSTHRKRKTKYSFDKYKDDYNLWRHKTSHVKVRKSRRKISPVNSNSDEIYAQERKRKKRSSYANEGMVKKSKIRDFDEMRQALLEKLQKRKAEEAKIDKGSVEVENSEIQEVEMGIDNTNYVDNPPPSDPNPDKTEGDKNENDDLDLIELRLAALESNGKQRANSNQRRIKNEGQLEGENGKTDDMNLDRYELLLRAEALKTAILKKHQKRLNKAKEISNETNNPNSSNNISPLRGESLSDDKPSTSNMSNNEQNAQKEVESEEVDDSEKNSLEEMRVANAAPTMSSTNVKKIKTKRKKRKSDSLQINAKENTENADIFEEDDRTLRSQLLKDLLKKKSLKDSEKKPVLTDSVKASANQLPVINNEKLKEKERLLTAGPKKNPSEKVNVINTTKQTTVPRIPKPEIKRIIVHLGSDDSSDDNDGEDNSSTKNGENKQGNVSAKELNQSVQASYEKSVDLLLSQTWQKIEGEIAAARNAHDTPEAVYKHLPLSQRLEYIRLKKKIAERERLKKVKEKSSNQDSASRIDNPAPVSQTTTPLKSESKPAANALGGTLVSKNPASILKKVKSQENSRLKTVSDTKVNNLVKNGRRYVAPPNGLSVNQTNQRRSLLQSSQAFISKLKILLKKIKIEKTIEENYEKEISKLKTQINLFEKKKFEQRFKIKKLAEESLKTYKVIQQITNSAKKPEEKPAEKKQTSGEEFKSENAVASEESKCNEATTTTAAEDFKNDISKGKNDEVNESENVCLPSAGHLHYNSPLLAFTKMSDNSDRVDPNVVVCQFDLMGVCKDKECAYQHLRN